MNNEKRPKLKISFNWKEKLILLISTLPIIAMWLYLWIMWNEIPNIVPTHFGFSGVPDNFGNKKSLFIIPIIASILHLTLALLSKIPHSFNYPVNVTDKNAEALYKIGKQTMLLLDMEISLLFAILLCKSIQVAIGNESGLGIVIVPIFMVIILGTVIYETIRMKRFKS